MVDIDVRLQAKGIGYQRWATVYNLKQMAQTMIFLREHGIEDIVQLREKTKQSTERYDQLDEKIKTTEKRLVEIASLKNTLSTMPKQRIYMQITVSLDTVENFMNPIGRQ